MARIPAGGGTQPRKLPPQEVTHLAFEGGGGKGGAYLGALAAFSHPDIGIFQEMVVNQERFYHLDRDRINGIGGTSAGAITATMVASDYSLQELTRLTLDRTILGFFEPPGDDKSYRPWVKRGTLAPVTHDRTGTSLTGTQFERRNSNPWLRRQAVRRGIGALLGVFRRFAISDPTIAPLLRQYQADYAENLWFDYGLFAGTFARTYLARKLIANAGPIWQHRVDSGTDMTFADHASEFGSGLDLVLLGTDVEHSAVGRFGTHATPDFKVADAARISMGIPVAFKPVRIPASEYRDREGLWVDGGVLNNFPLHVFDRGSTLEPGMLGLRLGTPSRTHVTSLKSYLGASFNTLLDGASNREIRTPQDRAQSIDLPTGNLDTFKFLASRQDLQAVSIDTASDVFQYFRDATGQNIGVDPSNRQALERFLADRLNVLWRRSRAPTAPTP